MAGMEGITKSELQITKKKINLDSCFRRNDHRVVGRYMRHGVRTEEEKMDSRLRGNDRRVWEWQAGE